MAQRTGLEPATSDVTGRHSNQLNYHSEKYTVLLAFASRLAVRRTSTLKSRHPKAPPNVSGDCHLTEVR